MHTAHILLFLLIYTDFDVCSQVICQCTVTFWKKKLFLEDINV